MIIHLSLFAIADQRAHQTRAFRMALEPRWPIRRAAPLPTRYEGGLQCDDGQLDGVNPSEDADTNCVNTSSISPPRVSASNELQLRIPKKRRRISSGLFITPVSWRPPSRGGRYHPAIYGGHVVTLVAWLSHPQDRASRFYCGSPASRETPRSSRSHS